MQGQKKTKDKNLLHLPIQTADSSTLTKEHGKIQNKKNIKQDANRRETTLMRINSSQTEKATTSNAGESSEEPESQAEGGMGREAPAPNHKRVRAQSAPYGAGSSPRRSGAGNISDRITNDRSAPCEAFTFNCR